AGWIVKHGSPRFLALGFALGLNALLGCAQRPGTATAVSLETNLTAAERAALVYVQLPSCPQPAGECSDPAVVAKINAAETAARAAVTAARAAPGDPTAYTRASAALDALTAVLL